MWQLNFALLYIFGFEKICVQKSIYSKRFCAIKFIDKYVQYAYNMTAKEIEK